MEDLSRQEPFIYRDEYIEMNTILKYGLCALLAAVACSKMPEQQNDLIGKEIHFSTSVEESVPDTKVTLRFWESWVYPAWDDNDQVKILKHSSSGASDEAVYTYNTSTIQWSSASPLRWTETGPHDFYVAYPSSTKIIPVSTPTVGENPRGRIEAEITRNMSNGDPNKFYMVGATHSDAPEVQKQFYMTPAVSVFRITVENKYAAGLRISSVQVVAWDEPYWTSSSNQMYMYGKYYVDIEGIGDGYGYYAPSVSYGGLVETPPYKSLQPSYAKTMSMDEKASFTFYAIPQNYKRLAVTLNLTGAITKSQQINFINTSNSNAGFDPFKKYDLSVTLK